MRRVLTHPQPVVIPFCENSWTLYLESLMDCLFEKYNVNTIVPTIPIVCDEHIGDQKAAISEYLDKRFGKWE
ncbi:MAG: hypothetical protein WA667_18385 [Candidatus Nitrosopolaris sp.]